MPLVEIARRRGLISDEQHGEVRKMLVEISKMISGLIEGLENREGAGAH